MQQIKDVYFLNLHNFATLLIFNGIQIKKNCTSIYTSISAATSASS